MAMNVLPRAGKTTPLKAIMFSLLCATALGGCAQIQDMLTPRVHLLTEIEQDLYRAIIMSDKIERLRTTHPNPRQAAAQAAKAEADRTAVRSVDGAGPIPQGVPRSVAYLNTSEVVPVQMTFSGDAQKFFEKVAKDIDYRVETVGKPRDVALEIKANGEPLFGVAIRAANQVEKDMKVRFNMEEKLIRVEYVGQ